MSVHAHKLVAELCCEMANAIFEEHLARDNETYRAMRAAHPGRSVEWLRKKFVRACAPELVADARATLAEMLGKETDPGLRATIYDALIKDAALRRGRANKRRLLN